MGLTVTETDRATAERGPARRLLDAVATLAPGLRPAAQRWLIRGGYAIVNRWLNDVETGCMNYGYAALEGSAATRGADTDEVYELALYGHVAGAAPLEGAEVLEVGCGRGGGAAFVARRFDVGRLTGLDFSEGAIDFASAHHTDPRLRFVHGDAENLPFADASFDAVVNVESSHCYPDVDRFVAEVYRVLRPGGSLLFADLRAREDVEALRRSFPAAGFQVEAEEPITANVVRALELDTPRRAAFVRERAPRPVRKHALNIAGGGGSEVYESLRNGDLEYLRFALRKPLG